MENEIRELSEKIEGLTSGDLKTIKSDIDSIKQTLEGIQNTLSDIKKSIEQQ